MKVSDIRTGGDADIYVGENHTPRGAWLATVRKYYLISIGRRKYTIDNICGFCFYYACCRCPVHKLCKQRNLNWTAKRGLDYLIKNRVKLGCEK